MRHAIYNQGAPVTSERNERVFAIAWYDSTQWELLMRVATDRAALDDTFEEWEANALNAERQIQAAGHTVTRFSVDVTELEKWCRERHMRNNSSSRARYVAQASHRPGRTG